MQTVVKDGFTIERGPDSFLARKTSMSRLAKEVGMSNEEVEGNGSGVVVIVGRGVFEGDGWVGAVVWAGCGV